MPESLTSDELFRLVDSWTYPYWRFSIRSPRLQRNKGIGTVLGFESAGVNLMDAPTALRVPASATSFNLEIPFNLPMTADEARLKAWDLVRWVTLHETGEFFMEAGKPLYNPHDVDAEEVIYRRPIPTLWRTDD